MTLHDLYDAARAALAALDGFTEAQTEASSAELHKGFRVTVSNTVNADGLDTHSLSVNISHEVLLMDQPAGYGDMLDDIASARTALSDSPAIRAAFSVDFVGASYTGDESGTGDYHQTALSFDYTSRLGVCY